MDLFPEEIIQNTTEHLHAKYSRKSNVIYITVLVLFIVAISLTPFIKVNVTRQSRGVIRSEMESNTIQTVVGGKIIVNNIHENKNVNIGDTLIALESKHIEESINNHLQRIEINRIFISDIESMLSSSPDNLVSAKYLSEYDEYLAQINQQKLQSEYLLNEKNISDELFAKNVETKVDNKRIQNDYNASIKKEQFIHEQYQRKWNAELVLLQQENIERNAQIAQLREEKRKHIVISPIGGELLQVSGFQIGSYISAGYQLAQISPKGELIVECYVAPQDIGFFREDMHANFQLDAFNYNQWGMASGKVYEISGDILSINNQPVFKVRCTLETTHLKLKNGYKGELTKGMSLTGRFILTQRTISQLIFDKVDDWLNPKLVNK